MSKDSHTSKQWLWLLISGMILIVIATFIMHTHGWMKGAILGVGGLIVVFASSEMMIHAVDGFAQRKNMNSFVAGTMAGLSSNIPELVMLAFVLIASPTVGFIVTVLTLHVGAAAFGLYCGTLPRDVQGDAHMPKPLVSLSTDLYAAAAGVFFSLGMIMVLMKLFSAADVETPSLSVTDLYIFGVILLLVQVVAVIRLVKRFSGEKQSVTERNHDLMPVMTIVAFSVAGLVASVIGGHSVGEFAGILVEKLNEAGYSEMFGAVILSVFASSGAFVMIGTAHFQKKYNIAMANASGAITQVPFLVLPIAMIMLAVFTQTGIIPIFSGTDGVIPINLHTSSVILLGFPSMLVLWKAVQDDGKVNWLETTSMVAIFLLVIYLLVVHG
ncbi:MAG: hypothetical protein JKY19_04090 [Alcanivoracaceae bacterium]|nr:hypothetical protein [Alcanivoracaceae bacterium]